MLKSVDPDVRALAQPPHRFSRGTVGDRQAELLGPSHGRDEPQADRLTDAVLAGQLFDDVDLAETVDVDHGDVPGHRKIQSFVRLSRAVEDDPVGWHAESQREP